MMALFASLSSCGIDKMSQIELAVNKAMVAITHLRITGCHKLKEIVEGELEESLRRECNGRIAPDISIDAT